MHIISMDLHTGKTQFCVTNAAGKVLCEKALETRRDCLRQAVAGIPDPKEVVFENGPLAGFVMDALEGLDLKIIAADPTRNALISQAEDSDDRRDARPSTSACR
jgi:hypothetical protein